MGVTSEKSPFLAIVYANRNGIPPNRAQRARVPGPEILNASPEGESRYEEPRYSTEFRAYNWPKSLEISSAAELNLLCKMCSEFCLFKSNRQFIVGLLHMTTPHMVHGVRAYILGRLCHGYAA